MKFWMEMTLHEKKLDTIYLPGTKVPATMLQYVQSHVDELHVVAFRRMSWLCWRCWWQGDSILPCVPLELLK